MRLCWKISSIPELEHLTPEQRRRAIGSASRRLQRLRMVTSPVVMGALIGTIAGLKCYHYAGRDLAICAAIVSALFAAAVLYQYQIARIRISLRAQIKDSLAGERLPACLRCHYDLRGTTESRCPECGAPVVVPRNKADQE